MPSGPLMNLGDLAKPATALVNKISAAIGVLYEPRHIRNVADAEAYAAKVAAHSRIEVSEIERRGLERLVREEGRKQKNIEDISAMAIEHLKPNAKPDDVDDDWIVHFFAHARSVSDKEMQSLWARVLAGEANVAGSFSRRTLQFMSSLDKEDANLFVTLRKFCWYLAGDLQPVVWNYKDIIYSSDGINFPGLSHLESIGLIIFTPSQSYGLKAESSKIPVSYYDKHLIISIGNGPFNSGQCAFTKIGQELASVCNATASDDFFDWCLDHLIKQGHEPFCLL